VFPLVGFVTKRGYLMYCLFDSGDPTELWELKQGSKILLLVCTYVDGKQS
jgi:hypothetical protein